VNDLMILQPFVQFCVMLVYYYYLLSFLSKINMYVCIYVVAPMYICLCNRCFCVLMSVCLFVCLLVHTISSLSLWRINVYIYKNKTVTFRCSLSWTNVPSTDA